MKLHFKFNCIVKLSILITVIFFSSTANGLSIDQLGFNFSNNFTLSPKFIKTAPTISSLRQDYLFNDLDGLGFPNTIQVGLISKYNLSNSTKLDLGVNYTSWGSSTPLAIRNINYIPNNPIYGDSLTIFGKNKNKLSLLQLTSGIEWTFWNFKLRAFNSTMPISFYVAPEISANIFLASAEGQDTIRGNFSFNKNYFRVGTGIIIGGNIKISKKLNFNLGFRYQLPNLLLRKDDDPTTIESEALIREQNGLGEEFLHLFNIQFGLLFKL